jgi:hypothetical protein
MIVELDGEIPSDHRRAGDFAVTDTYEQADRMRASLAARLNPHERVTYDAAFPLGSALI